MDNTLTLTNGTVNVVYGVKRIDEGSVTWTSPSPQGDFDGTYRVERKAARSKTNILTRTATLSIPIYDSVNGKYTGFIQARTTLSAPSLAANAEVLKALRQHIALFDTAVNPDFRGEFNNGSDAY